MKASLVRGNRQRSEVRLALALPLGAALLAVAVLALLAPGAKADPTCPERSMFIVAHEDDDLLFQSPDLLEDIDAGNCVRTVFITAGDAALGETYWRGREEGSRAAYAQMAGVANSWTSSEPVLSGHQIRVRTLTAQPQISEVYLRLPDGNFLGEGFAATDHQSLARLWRSQHSEPSSLTPITQIQPVDGSASYSYGGLLATLEALIADFEPDVLATQDVGIGFGEDDHSDHVVAARLTELADASYEEEHAFRSFVDYASLLQPENVFGSQRQAKSQTYYTYGAHDPQACGSEEQCAEPRKWEYREWLKRQYVSAEWAVPGADAGPAQSVASQAFVRLDGSASSDPLDQDLSYEWDQIAGPAVTLSSRTAAKPSFTAPVGPATLKFELVVDNGDAESLPATVTVTVAAPERHQLSVTRSGTGSGDVTSSPSGIDCPGTCQASFDHGTVVTLSASPTAGSEFVRWTGACSGSGGCQLTMSAARSVGAEFALVPRYDLKVGRTGNGTGAVTSSPTGISCGSSCETDYESGTVVTLSANPGANSEFSGWSGGGCAGVGSCQVTMTGLREVSAQFVLQRRQLSVTKSGSGAGSVTSSPAGISCGATCGASFDHGTVVTLSASPTAGSEFVKWTGACSGSGGCQVTMSAAKSVGAEFALVLRYDLKVSRTGNGEGSVSSAPAGIDCPDSCQANYEEDTVVTLTADPAVGSEFTGWSGGGCSGTGTCQVTMTGLREVSAEFTLQRHLLTVAKLGSGDGSIASSPAGIDCPGSCQASFDHGTVVTLSADAAAGSEFVKWTGACSGSGGCQVTMSAARSVGAEFAPIPRFALKLSLGGNGAGTVSSSPAGIDCPDSCRAEYEEDAVVTLSADPAPGSEFSGWSGAGCSGVGSCEVTITGLREVSAEFTLQRHQLTVISAGAGSGTITSSPSGIDCPGSCQASFDHGTAVTLSADPAADTEAASWSGCDEVTATNECVVGVTAPREVTAELNRRPDSPEPEPKSDPDPEASPLPGPAPAPFPPETELFRARVMQLRGTASFAFRPQGVATALECSLAKVRRKPSYEACGSPVTYRALNPGRYTFKVRAVGLGGAIGQPVTRKFEILAPSSRARKASRSRHRGQPLVLLFPARPALAP